MSSKQSYVRVFKQGIRKIKPTDLLNNGNTKDNKIANIKKDLASHRKIKVGEKVENPLVWIDCEMTGLDYKNDHIIEISCLITNGKLQFVDDKVFEEVIYYDETELSKMNDWCKNQHSKSGLIKKILMSDPETATSSNIDNKLFNYLKKWIPESGIALLAGSSVHVDKIFLLKEFPKSVNYLHYRILDVSAIYEAAKRAAPSIAAKRPAKIKNHTALSDVLESIDDLRFYNGTIFGPADRRDADADASSGATTPTTTDADKFINSNEWVYRPREDDFK